MRSFAWVATKKERTAMSSRPLEKPGSGTRDKRRLRIAINSLGTAEEEKVVSSSSSRRGKSERAQDAYTTGESERETRRTNVSKPPGPGWWAQEDKAKQQW